MLRSRTTLRIVASGLLFIGGSVVASGAEAPTPPRYQLKPGQELKYHGTSEFKYDHAGFGSETDWQVWVVRQNDDGSWRLVLRSSQQRTQLSAEKTQRQGTPETTLAYFDLFPDGRIVPNSSLGFRLDPSSLFPRLPDDAQQVQKGWEEPGVRDESKTVYKQASADEDSWVLEADRESPMDKIYLSSHRSRFYVDRKRGVVRRVETKDTQGYGINGKGTGTTELAGVEERDAAWLKTFAEESDRYFEANRSYERLLEKAGRDAGNVEALLAEAETTLKDAREKLTLPVLREQADEQLRQQKGMKNYYVEEAKNRAAVLGSESADWETKDLEGKAHSLKGYRGKVVILDFWYRGCGWCIRAMPQMKQLADDFKTEPVAVLGMNTDQVEKDAQFVVDEMKLNYPTLKATGVPEKYHVRGFPTLVIIDQDGKIADIHVGYSPTLREDVSQSVKKLLSRK